MAEETKVTLQLDVADARRVLESLQKDAETAGGKASGGIRSAIRRGVGALGLGSAVGIGMNAVRGPTAGGFGDIVGESFNKLGYDLEQWAFGSLGESARASSQARQELTQVFGQQVGATGQITPGMRAWFESAKSLRMQEEHGKTLINQDSRFQGPGIEKLIERISKAMAELLGNAVKELGTMLLSPFRGGTSR